MVEFIGGKKSKYFEDDIYNYEVYYWGGIVLEIKVLLDFGFFILIE